MGAGGGGDEAGTCPSMSAGEEKWRALSIPLEMPFGSLRVIADSCSFIIDCFNTGERGEGRLLYNDAAVKCCVDGTLNAASETCP